MFWESKGISRALGIALLLLAHVPVLAPYSDLFTVAGGLLGVAGVANAALPVKTIEPDPYD